MYSNYNNNYNYRIELKNYKSYIRIYYKKFEIKWILQEFSNNEAYSIAQKILKETKKTTYNGIYRIFFCKSKKDVEIIYKHLYNSYYERKRFNINLIDESLKIFYEN